MLKMELADRVGVHIEKGLCNHFEILFHCYVSVGFVRGEGLYVLVMVFIQKKSIWKGSELQKEL